LFLNIVKLNLEFIERFQFFLKKVKNNKSTQKATKILNIKCLSLSYQIYYQKINLFNFLFNEIAYDFNVKIFSLTHSFFHFPAKWK